MLESKKNWLFNKMSEEVAPAQMIMDLLDRRGLSSDKEKEAFLKPSLMDLLEPSLLQDIDKAQLRIERAIETDEKIMVFGDYDSDGVTSTALIMETLLELGAACDYYIPNRFSEGYGPNPQAIEKIAADGFSLVITVDTGIAAFESFEKAKALGLDVIITDHHEVQGAVPDVLAVIHPKVSPNYAFKTLAGVGVAFKLSQHLLGYFPEQFLDLVAIGTIADLVPLEGENRILAKFGMEMLTRTDRLGLIALKEVSGIHDQVSEQDVGFGLGPRLNAVGRLGHAAPAVELLLTHDVAEAKALAEQINQTNQERQAIVKTIASEAEALVEQAPELHQNVIVVAKAGWNEGVLGIVASRLLRKYQRPVLCLTIKEADGIAKGSARSIDAFDLFKHGMDIREYFIAFGGHAQAAGMTLTVENIETVREALNAIAENSLAPEDYKEQVTVDAKLDLKQLVIQSVEDLNQLAPFGMANPKPVFYLKAFPKEKRQIGADKSHLKLQLEKDQHQLNAIGFGMGELYADMHPDAEIECIGRLEINEWNNARSVQFMIEDVRITERQIHDFRGRKFWQKDLHAKLTEDYQVVHFNQPVIGPSFTSKSHQMLEENQQIKQLVVVDLPDKLVDFSNLLQKTTPEDIYLCFQANDDFLAAIPSREDFKWLYGYILKKETYHRKTEDSLVIRHKGWKLNKIECIIQVFSELDFVRMNGDVVTVNADVEKQPLTASLRYQAMLEKKEVEDILYYSNYHHLKTWLLSQIESYDSIEEENVYGL